MRYSRRTLASVFEEEVRLDLRLHHLQARLGAFALALLPLHLLAMQSGGDARLAPQVVKDRDRGAAVRETTEEEGGPDAPNVRVLGHAPADAEEAVGVQVRERRRGQGGSHGLRQHDGDSHPDSAGRAVGRAAIVDRHSREQNGEVGEERRDEGLREPLGTGRHVPNRSCDCGERHDRLQRDDLDHEAEEREALPRETVERHGEPPQAGAVL
jgi:hypothetical protein